MRSYEHDRLIPFRDAKIGYHSNADLISAYLAWAEACPGRREPEWCTYCDIRDGFASGTNAAIKEQLRKQQYGNTEAHSILKQD